MTDGPSDGPSDEMIGLAFEIARTKLDPESQDHAALVKGAEEVLKKYQREDQLREVFELTMAQGRAGDGGIKEQNEIKPPATGGGIGTTAGTRAKAREELERLVQTAGLTEYETKNMKPEDYRNARMTNLLTAMHQHMIPIGEGKSNRLRRLGQ